MAKISSELGDINAGWLSWVVPGDVTIAGCPTEEISVGVGFTGQIGRVQIEYENGLGGPTSIIAKLPSVKQQVIDWYWIDGHNIYLNEIAFYRDVAPNIALRIPEMYYGKICGLQSPEINFEDARWTKPGV